MQPATVRMVSPIQAYKSPVLIEIKWCIFTVVSPLVGVVVEKRGHTSAD